MERYLIQCPFIGESSLRGSTVHILPVLRLLSVCTKAGLLESFLVSKPVLVKIGGQTENFADLKLRDFNRCIFTSKGTYLRKRASY